MIKFHGGGGTCLNAPSSRFNVIPCLTRNLSMPVEKNINRLRIRSAMTNYAFTLAEVFTPHPNSQRKHAFTLAEVLITLGIIGVVAAMTMPSLIASHKEKETVVKLKKFYSTMANAFLLAQNEHTEIKNWLVDGTGKQNAEIVFNNIKPYLSLSKECGFEKGCLTDGYVKTLDGRDYNNYNNNTNEYHAVLADGTQFFIYMCSAGSNCPENMLGNIKVDVDGFRGKYTFGQDVFILHITNQGIVPVGIQDDDYPFDKYCNKSKMTSANGQSCAAWVILNENMDYLHCDDLNWDTKTKCK